MNADGTQDADFAPLSQTTLEDGAIRFDNLPQLTNGQYYAIRETKTPDGFEEGSLELYDVTNTAKPTPITAGENGYFRVATNADVASTPTIPRLARSPSSNTTISTPPPCPRTRPLRL